MSETGIRLTIGTILSIIWFAILNGATDWPTALVFLVAVICGFFLSVIDVVIIFVVSAIFD